jgi:hypothetical protein
MIFRLLLFIPIPPCGLAPFSLNGGYGFAAVGFKPAQKFPFWTEKKL